MSELELSTTTRTLLRAAKAEGPSAASRAKIWSGVSTATKTGVVAGASASKLLAAGTLLGSAVTVGLAMMLMHLGPVNDVPARAAAHAGAPLPFMIEEPPAASKVAATTVAHAPAPPKPRPKAIVLKPKVAPVAQEDADDLLMREASLVAEARSALVRGDAKGALQALGATRSFKPRQLEPEELALEAQALRAIGKKEEASGAMDKLKTAYPDHALAR
jgi:hypothetical protein